MRAIVFAKQYLKNSEAARSSVASLTSV